MHCTQTMCQIFKSIGKHVHGISALYAQLCLGQKELNVLAVTLISKSAILKASILSFKKGVQSQTLHFFLSRCRISVENAIHDSMNESMSLNALVEMLEQISRY